MPHESDRRYSQDRDGVLAYEDELANRLYDRLNPEPDVKINVSKAECIRRVKRNLVR